MHECLTNDFFSLLRFLHAFARKNKNYVYLIRVFAAKNKGIHTLVVYWQLNKIVLPNKSNKIERQVNGFGAKMRSRIMATSWDRERQCPA
jgi:hypothetical protein